MISGDFYWIAESDGLIYLIVGDCAGHGVPGAILSVLAYSLFDYAILKKHIKKTHKILREVDNRFVESFSSHDNKNIFDNDWIDVSLCCIEPETNTIYFSGARRDALVINSNGANIIKGCNYPIGGWQLESNRLFETQKIIYEKGDTLYLGTDGFQDQINCRLGKRYQSANLHNFLTKNSQYSMNTQKELLETELQLWSGTTTQTDDICIVGIRL